MSDQPPVQPIIPILNRWLRREHAVVMAYSRALQLLGTSTHAALLARCRESHLRRVELLADQVLQHGGRPQRDSGALGVTLVALQTLAALLSEPLALRALRAGERFVRQSYQQAGRAPEGIPRMLAQRRLLPEQRWTAASIAAVTS